MKRLKVRLLQSTPESERRKEMLPCSKLSQFSDANCTMAHGGRVTYVSRRKRVACCVPKAVFRSFTVLKSSWSIEARLSASLKESVVEVSLPNGGARAVTLSARSFHSAGMVVVLKDRSSDTPSVAVV